MRGNQLISQCLQYDSSAVTMSCFFLEEKKRKENGSSVNVRLEGVDETLSPVAAPVDESRHETSTASPLTEVSGKQDSQLSSRAELFSKFVFFFLQWFSKINIYLGL